MHIEELKRDLSRRKAEEAVKNELELRQERKKDEAFVQLREDMRAEVSNQAGELSLIVSMEAHKTHVSRTDSGKMLTISFSPAFHSVALSFIGGAIGKRTLAVEVEGSRVYYRRENGMVLPTHSLPSFVTEIFAILMA
jgi:hypothetical protein